MANGKSSELSSKRHGFKPQEHNAMLLWSICFAIFRYLKVINPGVGPGRFGLEETALEIAPDPSRVIPKKKFNQPTKQVQRI